MKTNFISYLEAELARRQAANSYYSLRAFARDLNIEASLLSKLIRRKVPLTIKMFERLSPAVGLDENLHKEFYERMIASEGEDKFSEVPVKQLGVEELALIQDWYYFTIVELTALCDFQSEPQWIANKIGITLEQAESAIERLLGLNMLKRLPNGDLIAAHESGMGLKISANDPDSHRVLLQRRWEQIMDRSLVAIEELPVNKRVQRNLSVAIDSALVEEAREKLRNFTRELVDDLERKSKKKDHIYELATIFFPLTKE